MGQLICSFQFPFRSNPLQFYSIERNLNGQLERILNRKGTGMEQNWNGNGTGMKREWNGNQTGMEQKFKGWTMEARLRAPSLYTIVQQAKHLELSIHCPSIKSLFQFRSIPVPFHSHSIAVPFPFRSHSIPAPFPFQSSSSSVPFLFN